MLSFLWSSFELKIGTVDAFYEEELRNSYEASLGLT